MNSTTKITRKTIRDKKGELVGIITIKEEKDFSGYDQKEFSKITKMQLFWFLLDCKAKQVKDSAKTMNYLKVLKKMDKTEMIWRAMENKISFDGVEEPIEPDSEREMVNYIRKNF